MKKIYFLLFATLLILGYSSGYSQKITTGIYSGVNLSDIHGIGIGGKWSFKPGPVQGLYLGYSLNKALGIETGINLSTIYYEHKASFFPTTYYPTEYHSYVLPPVAPYYQENGKMDFRSVRVPLLFTVSIPSELQLKMRAGFFFSSLQDYSVTEYAYYYPYDQEKPEKYDFGYQFSSGISYPLSENFKATFDIGYQTGKRKFLENLEYRHGSSEFTFGIAYTGFTRDKNSKIALGEENDSSDNKVTVKVIGGINYSWNQESAEEGKYYGYAGPSVGFSLNLPFGQGGVFQTGFSFERKGYAVKDSSASYYKLIRNENPTYFIDTRVQIDYAIVPAIVSFPVGKPDRLFFSTGPWVGFKLNARTVGAGYIENHSGSTYQLKKTIIYEDIEKAIKGFDLGWIFGLGMTVPVVKTYKVDMAIQYSAGFRDVFDKSGTGESLNPYEKSHKIRNRTISLFFGFRIP